MSDEVESPCNDVCIMDDGVCTSCGMNNQEVNTWYKMSNEDRQKVVDRIAATKAAE